LSYKKRGSLFHSAIAGNWGVIGFQKSQSSTREEIAFTVNVGVVSARLARFSPRRAKGEVLPTPDEWHWGHRLGFLMPEHDDVWWKIDGRSDSEVTPGVGGALVQYAVPEIAKHASDEALRDLWLTGRSPGLTDLQRLRNLAVLLHFLGPADRLPAVLQDIATISKGAAQLLEAKLQTLPPDA
jgi:hypothetical protein